MVWLSEAERVTEETLEEFEKKRDSRVAKMAKTTVSDTLRMRAVERHDGGVCSVAWLGIRLIIDDVHNEVVVAGQAGKAAMKAVVHPAVLHATTDAEQN